MNANSRRWARAGAASLAAVMAASLTVPFGAAPAAAAPGAAGEVEPIHLVIAVDESGSLSAGDLNQERIAAASIAMSELSPQSDVTVYGFGSRTDSVPAVDGSRMCRLKPGAGAQDREAIGACVEQNISRRAAGQGDDTDFVAALNQGIDALTQPPADDHPRMLLLLTDGRLDVRGDTKYGPDEAAQQRYAEEQLKELVVPKARQAGVQLWPIGFGADLDVAMLKFLAGNGGRTDCQGVQSVPVASQAKDATAAVAAMMDAFVQARCLDKDSSPQVPIADGRSLDLNVTVPAIATDGAINVVKGDPRVKVTYYGPDDKAVPAIGTVDETTYELAGTSGVVESMRIRNPRPGRWRIHLEAPANLAERMVSATALWQGVLRTVFVLDPPSPQPGEKFAVIMRPHTRSAEIADPAVLRGLSFTAQLAGGGGRTDRALTDDGTAPDARAGDAYFSAGFTLPAGARGTFEVVGTATGPGVTSDRQKTTFRTGFPGPQVRTKILLDTTRGWPGDEITGRVLATNDATTPRRVRIVLADLGDGDAVTVPAADAVLQPGAGETAFRLRIGAGATPGPAGGVVQVVDADTGAVLGNTPLDLTVLERPGLVDRWWKPVLAAFLLLTLVVVVVAVLRRRRAVKVSLKDVVVTLHEDGQRLEPPLKAPPGARFEFDIRVPDDGYPPSLLRVNPGAGRYAIERLPGGLFRLRLPEAEAPPGLPTIELLPRDVTALPNHPRLGLSAENPGRGTVRQRTGPDDDDRFDPADFERVSSGDGRTAHDDDL